MPPATTNSFKSWLKSNVNIKLSSDAAVTRITYEGITNFDSLVDFDKKAIELLPSICKEKIKAIPEDAAAGIAAEIEIPGANISSISVRRLIVAASAARYYKSVGRAMNNQSMHYTNILSNFKIEWLAYRDLRLKDELKAPTINDRDLDKKVIKWAPIFQDCLARTYGTRGPLSYILREEADVEDETADPLMTDDVGVTNCYYGKSGSLQDELQARLPHTGPIYKSDNASVFTLVEKACRNTTVESTVKSFARKKDGRGAYLAVIANHAGDTKYRSIYKKKMFVLQNIKWNGRAYPLETLVSNHRQAVDDIKDCSEHITVSVPDKSQCVEYLIDAITCSDNTLQAALGLIRANTNGMRSDFELASTSLIEVDPYRRAQKPSSSSNATISGIDFHAGRGSSGVDLRWHHPKEFRALPSDQKDELVAWQKTQEGKKVLNKSKEAASLKRKLEETKDESKKKAPRDHSSHSAWKKKLKKAVKTQNGLAHIMSVLAAEDKRNKSILSTLSSTTASPGPATATIQATKATFSEPVSSPATTVKLSSILSKRNGK